MGGRLLRHWISLPLLDTDRIGARLDTVDQLLEQPDVRDELSGLLSGMPDMERLCSRTSTGRISPKEMARLRDALDATAALYAKTDEWGITVPATPPAPLSELRETLSSALVDDPATIIGKGESISSQFDLELARLRGLLSDAQGTLDAIRDREAATTEIPSLKLAFNNVFGYYLEVRNSHKDKVPEHWHRKQTLVNAERYITDELKKFESEVLGAEEKIKTIELRLFGGIGGAGRGGRTSNPIQRPMGSDHRRPSQLRHDRRGPRLCAADLQVRSPIGHRPRPSRRHREGAARRHTLHCKFLGHGRCYSIHCHDHRTQHEW